LPGSFGVKSLPSLEAAARCRHPRSLSGGEERASERCGGSVDRVGGWDCARFRGVRGLHRGEDSGEAARPRVHAQLGLRGGPRVHVRPLPRPMLRRRGLPAASVSVSVALRAGELRRERVSARFGPGVQP